MSLYYGPKGITPPWYLISRGNTALAHPPYVWNASLVFDLKGGGGRPGILAQMGHRRPGM